MKNKLVSLAFAGLSFFSTTCNINKSNILGKSYLVDLNGDHNPEKVSFNEQIKGYNIDVAHYLKNSDEPWIRSVSSFSKTFIPEEAVFYDVDKDGDLDLFLKKGNKFLYCENKFPGCFFPKHIMKNIDFIDKYDSQLISNRDSITKVY